MIIDQYPECHRKIIFAGFNAKLEKIYISEPTNGNNSLHEPSNIKVVKVINFAAAKNIIVICAIFTFCNIHTHTWVLMGKVTARLFAFIRLVLTCTHTYWSIFQSS